ncbi:hypothetical protein R70199_06509 [Paraburkholderia domus]|nr:hypothetical protein R70199_06509 [Paraburkholderia domus]
MADVCVQGSGTPLAAFVRNVTLERRGDYVTPFLRR